MNTHILSSSSANWWWPSAAAAAVALTAVGAITAGPALLKDTPIAPDLPAEPDLSFVTPVRSCLHGQPNWSPALHGVPSRCGQAEASQDSSSGTAVGSRRPDRELTLP